MFEFLSIKKRLQKAERNYKEALAQQQMLEEAVIELAVREDKDGETVSQEDSE